MTNKTKSGKFKKKKFEIKIIWKIFKNLKKTKIENFQQSNKLSHFNKMEFRFSLNRNANAVFIF